MAMKNERVRKPGSFPAGFRDKNWMVFVPGNELPGYSQSPHGTILSYP